MQRGSEWGSWAERNERLEPMQHRITSQAYNDASRDRPKG